MMAERKSTRWLLAVLAATSVWSLVGLAGAAESLGGTDSVMAEGSKSAGGTIEEGSAALQQQVAQLAEEVRQLSGAQDDMLLYVALGIVFVMILLAIIVGLFVIKENRPMKNRLLGLEKRLAELENAYHSQQNHLIHQEMANDTVIRTTQMRRDSISSAVVSSRGSSRRENAKDYQVERAVASGSMKDSRQGAIATTHVQNQQPERWQAQSIVPSQSVSEKTEQEHVVSFVAKYNALPSEGITARDVRRDFFQEFSVQGFSCDNYAERISNPNAALCYVEAEVIGADYWAMHVKDGFYAVVPNAKLAYDSVRHETGGMMFAFDSNFAAGHTYRQIRVETPAFFLKRGGRWSVAKKGRLRLSE